MNDLKRAFRIMARLERKIGYHRSATLKRLAVLEERRQQLEELLRVPRQ